tara:strand:- start:232 stop:1011 length:780 start_codon:yes stop_codon:yes gene_type:complete
MKKNRSLKKLAFVIGGNGTIGSSIVKKFIEKKIKVVVLDIKLNSNPKKNFFQEKFNLANLSKIKSNLNRLVIKYGCPDILINSAYPMTKRWSKINFENLRMNDLKDNVNIHLNSSAWATWVIADFMKKSSVKGSIIFINSIYGILGQDNNIYSNTNIKSNPVYSIIKGGLISFSKNLASFYGKHNIRSNSIICGGIEGKIAGQKKKQNKVFINKYKKKTLLKKMATADEISSTVFFLSSDEASYITGSEVFVDGGFSAI